MRLSKKKNSFPNETTLFFSILGGILESILKFVPGHILKLMLERPLPILDRITVSFIVLHANVVVGLCSIYVFLYCFFFFALVSSFYSTLLSSVVGHFDRNTSKWKYVTCLFTSIVNIRDYILNLMCYVYTTTSLTLVS